MACLDAHLYEIEYKSTGYVTIDENRFFLHNSTTALQMTKEKMQRRQKLDYDYLYDNNSYFYVYVTESGNRAFDGNFDFTTGFCNTLMD
jgi:hypothetical protein